MASAQQAAGQPGDGLRGDGMGAPSPPPRSSATDGRLFRYPNRGLLGGVGAGISVHLGVDVAIVRFAMTVLIVLGGIGVFAYALAWALIPIAPESRGVPRPPGSRREAFLILLVAAAVLAALRHLGLLLGDSFIWPTLVGTCGLALVWRPTIAFDAPEDSARRFSPRRLLRRSRHLDVPRVLVGGLLVAVASAWLLHSSGIPGNLGKAIGSVAIVGATLGLLFGPSFVRLARSLSSERAARIREQERAEVAAHLHDSVLQTLALIQNRAEHPREVATLARRQERELRRWLFERPGVDASDSFKALLEKTAAEIEELHGVPIETVVVGDAALDDRLDALVQATREAITNAAKFAGPAPVAVYAEMGSERGTVFVRDRGEGFDLGSVPPDRRGVRDSIVGRLERHGGRATINSDLGEGTEVELVVERARPDRGQVSMSPVQAQ